MKGEMDGLKNEVKRSKEGLKHDLKTVKDKSLALLD
jgi:hypothetical protein